MTAAILRPDHRKSPVFSLTPVIPVKITMTAKSKFAWMLRVVHRVLTAPYRIVMTTINKTYTMCQQLIYIKKIITFKVVDKFWKQTDGAVAISRGWMSHYQVIDAAYEMKGDNAYLKQKNGLDFGIRYNVYPN